MSRHSASATQQHNTNDASSGQEKCLAIASRGRSGLASDEPLNMPNVPCTWLKPGYGTPCQDGKIFAQAHGGMHQGYVPRFLPVNSARHRCHLCMLGLPTTLTHTHTVTVVQKQKQTPKPGRVRPNLTAQQPCKSLTAQSSMLQTYHCVPGGQCASHHTGLFGQHRHTVLAYHHGTREQAAPVEQRRPHAWRLTTPGR